MTRLLALLQAILLLFSGSPSVMALQFNAGLRSLGSSSGGQGSAPSLQNAGAASAALTATLAKQSLQKSQQVISGLQSAQQAAATAATGTTADGKTVVNGLQLPASSVAANQLPGLVPYYNAQNPAPSGVANIPNGSVPVPGTWSGVGPRTAIVNGQTVVVQPGLQQSTTGSANNPSSATVTINQTQQSAYLYWSHFNVGAQTTVNFTQSGNNGSPGTWIAFNKVMTASDPSHIFGKINAPGQVYILNQGGILFHAGSSVNVQSLVAATLPINTSLAGDSLNNITAQGLANNSGDQFLFSALPLTQSKNSFADNFNPGNISSSQVGGIIVEKGASINTPVSSDNTGGRVMLAASSVVNNGTISTPNGQSILAAGLQVGAVPHPSSDPSLRGLDVYVGQVADASGGKIDAFGQMVGNLINNGLISIPQGAASVVGKNIQQNGVIDGITSVNLNSRVDLEANYNAVVNGATALTPYSFGTLTGGSTGSVELGANSLIRLLPDITSGDTVTGDLVLPSIISVMGQAIKVDEDAIVLAPGALPNPNYPIDDMTTGSRSLKADQSTVSAILQSGISFTAGNWDVPTSASPPMLMLGTTGDGVPAGSITVGSRAVISAAGNSGAVVDSSQYIQKVQFRGAELANSPLQQNSPIRGKDIVVNLLQTGVYNGNAWAGSPLGDLTGYANLIQRGIGQLTANGGSISLLAGDSVSVSPQAAINVSGGWVQYAAASYATTDLINSYGQIVPIAGALPNQSYTGIAPLSPPLYYPSYVSGANGGKLTIQAPSMSLGGQLYGGVTYGPYQIRSAASQSSLPAPSLLSLTFKADTLYGNSTIPSETTAPAIIFQAPPSGGSVSGIIDLDPSFFGAAGFGSLNILNHDGSVLLPQRTSLSAAPGGAISISAQNITVLGSIDAPAGRITLTTYNTDYAQDQAITISPVSPFTGYAGQGILMVGGNASLDASGFLANNLVPGTDLTPILPNGGSITLQGYEVLLQSGSVINVSGGGILNPKGKVSYGNAGSVTITAGQDVKNGTIHDGALLLAAGLEGYAGLGMKSGSLSITAPAIQIGGSAPMLEIGGKFFDNRVLTLQPSFFDQGGFSSFTLSGVGIGGDWGVSSATPSSVIPGVNIVAGTTIVPKVQNEIFLSNGDATIYQAPGNLSPAVLLTLNANQLNDNKQYGKTIVLGEVTLGTGSTIDLNPQVLAPSSLQPLPGSATGNLTISGTVLNLLGNISVPGGSITANAGAIYDSQTTIYAPEATLNLGQSVLLSTAGTALANPLMVRSSIQAGGIVLPGGSISLSGNIVGEGSAHLNVSGTSANFYEPASLSGSALYGGNGGVTTVSSSGGVITLNGSQELLYTGSLQAFSGGVTATGGTLNVVSGRFYAPSDNPDLRDLNLTLLQSTSQMTSQSTSDSAAKIWMGYIAADQITAGGFANVSLQGNLRIPSAVSLTVPGILNAATGGVIDARGAVTLQASFIALGMPFEGPLASGDSRSSAVYSSGYMSPTAGSGSLHVTAAAVDIGNLLLKDIGGVDRIPYVVNGVSGSAAIVINAGSGAIRGDGTLDASGDIALLASQIYPTTETTFSIAAYNNSSITIEQQGGALPLPLSAGGTLSFEASKIIQNGTLVAPFGQINLGWSGSGTSPEDALSGAGLPGATASTPTTLSLTLGNQSVTSVSGNDPLLGSSVTIPYGLVVNGSAWIDPAGNTITSSGAPQKGVNLSASGIITDPNSSINVSGGGNLESYQWIGGNGGTVDIAASGSGSFAIIPSYSSPVSPFSPYAVSSAFGGDVGYATSGIPIGEQLYLAGGGGLSAGVYTILPARYAVLPNAWLITPEKASIQWATSLMNPDGSILMRGYQYGAFDQPQSLTGLTSLYQVLSPAAVKARAAYQLYQASSFLTGGGPAAQVVNGGNLVMNAGSSMSLQGGVQGTGAVGARVDLSSSLPFVIGNTFAQNSGEADLNATVLNDWNAGSLLIGGTRGAVTIGGTTMVTVNAASVTVDPGVVLSGNDLVLAAATGITFGDGVSVSALGSSTVPDEQIVTTGTGAAVRISTDSRASIIRSGVVPDASELNIGKGVTLEGGAVILDSSGGGSINQSVTVNSKSVSISAGSLALVLDPTISTLSSDLSEYDSRSLVLGGTFLSSLQQAVSVSMSSYSTLDLYGTMQGQSGGVFGGASLASLSVHSGEIRGFDLSGGTASFSAKTISLDNAGNVHGAGPVTASPDGFLELDAATITIGENALAIDQFAYVLLNATGVVAGSASGSLNVGTASMSSDLFITAPMITATAGNFLTAKASGNVVLQSPDAGNSTTPVIQPGAGASLSFTGATVSVSSSLSAPSGEITLHALSGDVTVGGSGNAILDVSGYTKTIQSAQTTANAGTISLVTDTGNVNIAPGATLKLSARGSSSGGTLNVLDPLGNFLLDPSATLSALGGSSGGKGGGFFVDTASLDPSASGLSLISSIAPQLSSAGFTESLSFRIRTGDVNLDTYVAAHAFSLSADKGTIDVTPNGVIDASGTTGGSISLQASGSVILEPNSYLTVHGDNYDNAGKGGSVFLSAGAEVNGQINQSALLDLQTASAIDVGVTAVPSPNLGQVEGILHLRVPQVWGADSNGNPVPQDVQIAHLDSTITGAPSIAIEAYQLYDLTGTSGVITKALQTQVMSDAQHFFGVDGASPNAAAILGRLLQNQSLQIASQVTLNPGVEIINSSGNLSLQNDWDFSLARFGPLAEVLTPAGQPIPYKGTGPEDVSGKQSIGTWAGFLTLRASGNVVLHGSLSDGFGDSINPAAEAGGNNYGLYFAPLSPLVKLASGQVVGQSSWTFTITAGSDIQSAGATGTVGSGFVKLGIPGSTGGAIYNPGSDPNGNAALTTDALNNNYQVIRTGTGDITVAAAGDIQLLNQFASIYTAGTQVVDPTLGGTFDPSDESLNSYAEIIQNQNVLGTVQQPTIYTAQYSVGGGNVMLTAGGNIAHLQLLTQSSQTPYANDPTLTADSSRQLPNNWISRRGNTDPSGNWMVQPTTLGTYGATETYTTSWWINFANFFEGVGALGGGNVSMVASRSIMDVDAVVPTQGRVTARATAGGVTLAPGSGTLVETGGGDLTISVGANLLGGVYYVERGNATVSTAGSIATDATRDVAGDTLYASLDPNNKSYASPGQETWLPTSFFLGQGHINVFSGGSALLGPVGNVFLLPASINDGIDNKTYFSTYSADTAAGVPPQFSAMALSGDLTIRTELLGEPAYTAWMQSDGLAQGGAGLQPPGGYQPWIRINEQTPGDSALSTAAALSPGSMSYTAMVGNINLQGNMTLAPDPFGGLQLLSADSLGGVYEVLNGQRWSTSMVNVSDASMGILPSAYAPFSQSSISNQNSPLFDPLYTQTGYFGEFTTALSESGSLNQIFQTKLDRHGSSLLHAADTHHVQILAGTGDISGLKLFSPKATDVMAGNDISNVGLYIQNDNSSDVSIISAGGSMTLYDPNSPSLVQANLNLPGLAANDSSRPQPLSGDIQMSGPGTMEVLAGGNINLGAGSENVDGTSAGITSIGNSRNPVLPFQGANIVVAAGVVETPMLSASSSMALDSFAESIVNGPGGQNYLQELSAQLAYSGDPALFDLHTPQDFDPASRTYSDMSSEERSLLELQIFYIVLRDSGRNHGDPASVEYGTYAAAQSGIKILLGNNTAPGNIDMQSRSIKTKNGGNIAMLTPGGGISMADYSASTKVSSTAPPGIVTGYGGAIDIYSKGNVSLGIGRIFTLRGGDLMIWSEEGNIAAGASSKTVASAPPTRVLIDPASAAVLTDLSGLATGGGIGTLQTVHGVPAANVDLVAVAGLIDAGDAGIRSSGNLHLAATKILNADNIKVAGLSVGVPPSSASSAPAAAPAAAAPPASAPSSAASTAAAAASNSADKTADKGNSAQQDETPSEYTITIDGYGGSADDEDSKKAANAAVAPVQASL